MPVRPADGRGGRDGRRGARESGHRRLTPRTPRPGRLVRGVTPVRVRADGVRRRRRGGRRGCLVRRHGAVDVPQPASYALPLGLDAYGSEGPSPIGWTSPPSEQLLLYTAGVTEARNEDRHFHPLGERANLLKDLTRTEPWRPCVRTWPSMPAGRPTTTPRCSCCVTTVMGKENLFPSSEWAGTSAR